MITVSRVHARTGAHGIAMKYDTLARSKWEARTGLDLDDFDLPAYVKTIDEEVLTTVGLLISDCACIYARGCYH